MDKRAAKQLVNGLQNLQNLGKQLTDQYSTKEILDKMTPEQREFMEKAKEGFNLTDVPLEKKGDAINEILKSYGITGNR